jgi:hypothetical protein
MRETRIDGFDANGRPCGYSGDKVLAAINQHAGKGVFGHDYKMIFIITGSRPLSFAPKAYRRQRTNRITAAENALVEH